MMDAERLLELASDSIQWYWEHGIQRDPFNALSSVWLDDLYRVRATAEQILAAVAAVKPCMAVWGPSQSGKSTLLSKYLDDAPGGPHPLDWSEDNNPEHRARFSRTADADHDPQVICLNPFNQRSDASGCVTRYVLRDESEVPDHAHPVEIKLSTPMQVMHALAAGYASECRPADAGTVVWEEGSFLAEIKKPTKCSEGEGRPREAFECLRDFADILELLIKSNEPRYQSLGRLDRWDSHIRTQLLGQAPMFRSSEEVIGLAETILWNGHEELNRQFKDLCRKTTELSDIWGRRRIFCSLRTAAMLLDISAYEWFLNPAGEVARRVAEQIRALTYDIQENRVVIGLGHPHRLIRLDTDFGLLQGLVRELVVPLRKRAIMTRPGTFAEFMRKADLLDFPGVALQSIQHDRVQINLATLKPSEFPRLLTQVLKRGKTSSVVAGYASTLSLDSFSILLRITQYPAQPRQLISGIEMWWKCFDPHFDPYRTEPGRPPLPLNLVLTFVGQLISDVVASGVGQGLAPVCQRLGQLGIVSNPKLATLLTTNYPQWQEGMILGTDRKPLADSSKLQKASKDIQEDRDFGKWLENETSRKSFDAMLNDQSGTDYLFEVAAGQFNRAAKSALLVKLANDNMGRFLVLLENALPDAMDERTRRNTLLEEVRRSLGDALNRHDRVTAVPNKLQGPADISAACSLAIRTLMCVDGAKLDPVPLHAKHEGVIFADFVQAQYHRWIDTQGSIPHVDYIGLADPVLRKRFMRYLVEATPIQEVGEWIRKYLGDVRQDSDARDARSYVAMRMSNALWQGPAGNGGGRPHPDLDAIKGAFEILCLYEEGDIQESGPRFKQSPHFVAIVERFQTVLDRVLESHAGTRPPQSGDPELAQIKERFRQGLAPGPQA